jgi:plasmid stability protein
MGQVLIRKVPDEVISELKTKAQKRGVSLEAFLRDELQTLARPDPEELYQRLKRISQMSPPVKMDINKVIREGRNSR